MINRMPSPCCLARIRRTEPKAAVHGRSAYVLQALAVGFHLKKESRNCCVSGCEEIILEGRTFPGMPVSESPSLNLCLASVSGNCISYHCGHINGGIDIRKNRPQEACTASVLTPITLYCNHLTISLGHVFVYGVSKWQLTTCMMNGLISDWILLHSGEKSLSPCRVLGFLFFYHSLLSTLSPYFPKLTKEGREVSSPSPETRRP